MIKILGIKRILALVLLVAVNAALAAGVYLYAAPEILSKENQLRSVRGEISTRQADIDRMQVEFSKLEEQQAIFETLKKRGFFGNQGRREAQLVFENIQQKAGVVSAVANIQAGVIEDNPEAQKAAHKILRSPVTLKIQAMDDVDVFRYIFLLEKYFPGHVMIENIEIKRIADVSGTILRSIATGSSPGLVEANIGLTWRSMIPESQIINTESGKKS